MEDKGNTYQLSQQAVLGEGCVRARTRAGIPREVDCQALLGIKKKPTSGSLGKCMQGVGARCMQGVIKQPMQGSPWYPSMGFKRIPFTPESRQMLEQQGVSYSF